VSFPVLMAVTLKTTIFWDVMPCSLAEVYLLEEHTYVHIEPHFVNAVCSFMSREVLEPQFMFF
jgi:hypothetical protein